MFQGLVIESASIKFHDAPILWPLSRIVQHNVAYPTDSVVTPPNAFGITRANMPRTTATLRNPTTSAKRCSGLFAMSSSTRKKLKLSCAPFHDHDVELFMRGYIT